MGSRGLHCPSARQIMRPYPRCSRRNEINLLKLELGCQWSCVLTPAERIEKAFDDAHVVIATTCSPARETRMTR